MENIKPKGEEKMKDNKSNQSTTSGENTGSQTKGKNLKSKTSSAEQVLDTFLLGNLEDGHGDAGVLFELRIYVITRWINWLQAIFLLG